MLWNIRKQINKYDYLYALVPEHPFATKNGYVLYHRIVMENELNRLLTENEIVHHIDGNKFNNSVENLEVMNNREHARLHAHQRTPNGRKIVHLICANCGKEFDRYHNKRPESKGAKNAFCSRRCNGLYNGFKKKSL
jgi:hypothetical protein